MKFEKDTITTRYMSQPLKHSGCVSYPFGIYKTRNGWKLAHIPQERDIWWEAYPTLKEAKSRLAEALKVVPLSNWDRDKHPFDGVPVETINDLRDVLKVGAA